MKNLTEYDSTDLYGLPHVNGAHHIPATDYVRADFENGTLARVNRDRRSLTPGWWIIPGLVVSAAFWITLAVWLIP